MNHHPAVEQLSRCWSSLDELFEGLDDEQWSTPSLCPDWTVRGVLVHLGAIEHMLSGEPPGSMAAALPLGKAAEWMREVA